MAINVKLAIEKQNAIYLCQFYLNWKDHLKQTNRKTINIYKELHFKYLQKCLLINEHIEISIKEIRFEKCRQGYRCLI